MSRNMTGGRRTICLITSLTGLLLTGCGASTNAASPFGPQQANKYPIGEITTVAGIGKLGYSGDGGQAAKAKLDGPTAMTFDNTGNLYVSTWNDGRVRKISAAGVITTVAGNGDGGGDNGFSGDGGPAVKATLANADALATDSTGALYIADGPNNRIRKVDNAGIITTVAGTGQAGFAGDGGPAVKAEFDNPAGLAFNANGDLYVLDDGNNRLRKINTKGVISTVAAKLSPLNGAVSVSNKLGQPELDCGVCEIAVAKNGSVYVPDTIDNTILKVGPKGQVSTIAGTGTQGFSGDNGPATNAELTSPEAVVLDAGGNLYVSDTGNATVRKIDARGTITTVAGQGPSSKPGVNYSGDGEPATQAHLDYPYNVDFDKAGNLYVDDITENRVREIHLAD